MSGRYFELILKSNAHLINKNIYIPIFNCPSVYKIIKKYFKKVYFYDLDLNFNPKLNKIKTNSIILLVNYLKPNKKKLKQYYYRRFHCFLDKKIRE